MRGSPEARARERGRGSLCATAHPLQIRRGVEPLIGGTIAPPPALAAILGREGRKVAIAPELEALVGVLVGEALAV